MSRGIFLLVAVLIANGSQAKEVFVGKTLSVTDGDTLRVQPDSGGPPRKLRLDGIDAPEICQAGGKASRDALVRYTLHQRVTVTVRSYDDYGRGLARVQFKGQDVGAQMVLAGHAWSYRWRRSLGPYASEEAIAQQSGLGLFANGPAELPRDFRKRHGSCYPTKR